MKRLAILFLLFPLAVSAGPLNWAKHHKRFIAIESAAVTGAIIHWKGQTHCLRVNVERCDENYGANRAWFGLLTGWSVAAGPAIAEGCWKNEGGKFCNAFAWSGPAYQATQGALDWRVPKERE